MFQGYFERVNLKSLYDVIFIRTGFDIVKEVISEREFPYNRFKELFKSQIYPFYSRYLFKTKRFNIYVRYNIPFRFDEPAPEFISRVAPVSLYGLYFGEFRNYISLSPVSYLSMKPGNRFYVPFKYEKPVLYCGWDGEVEILAQYRLEFDEERDEIEIPSDMKDLIYDLCSAYMMIVIGRTRRHLKIADLPIEFDGEALVGEGEEILEKVKGELMNFTDLTVLNW